MSLTGDERDFSTQWRERIEDWLQDQGWQVGRQSAQQVRWVLTARDAQGRPLAIAHTSEGRDMLVIALGIQVPDDVQQQIAQMEVHERRNLLFDMHEGLIMIGVQWDGISEPLRRFQLQATCHFDGLTKNELLRLIRTVRDAGVLMLDKVARALNQPPVLRPEPRPLGFRPPDS